MVVVKRDSSRKVQKRILLYPQMICEYGEKAYACGARHHDRESMQTMLWNDLKSVVESYENSAN